MSWLEGARARVRLLFSRRAAEARFDEEIRLHIDLETERLVRERGLEPHEARRRALATFGGVENHKEALRYGRGVSWLSGMSLDLKLGLRMLVKYPGLTFVGVLGLAVAVAIGAVTFSILYTAIDTSLPLDEGDRIVAIQNLEAGENGEGRRTHLHDLMTWRGELRAVQELGAYRTVDRNLITRDGRPEPVRIAEMTASGFRVPRVPPLLGRYFNADDERPGASPVVVIGYSVWQNRFAGRPDIVGQSVQLGATRHTVIGVMPKGFAFPINNRIWTPLGLDPTEFERGKAPAIEVFGRLTPGATLADARTQLTTIGRRLSAAYPMTHEHIRPRVLPYTLSFIDSPEFVWAFRLVQFLISMVLVVIGTNVAILVYARTATRMGEIAVRTALGASRGRIVVQLFGEALVLSVVAAAVGVVVAQLTLRQVNALGEQIGGEQIPFWMHFGVSPGVLLYVVGLTLLAAVIVGLLPALKATSLRVTANLQQLSPGGGVGMRLGRTWNVLIVAQVAIAVATLPVTIQGIAKWAQRGMTKPAYAANEFLAASVWLDREGVGTEETDALGDSFVVRYASLEAELVRRLEAEPGVSGVVLANAVPGEEPRIRVEVDAAAASSPLSPNAAAATAAGRLVGFGRVDPEFFDAFDVPILAGRRFQPVDVSAGATAIIVNRSFVQQVLGGGDALGRRVRQVTKRGNAPGDDKLQRGPWYEIVGVVPDFPQAVDSRTLQPKMYQAMVLGAVHPATFVVHVKGTDPTAFTGRLRDLAVAVDPMLRLNGIRRLDGPGQDIERSLDRLIFAAIVLVTLSVVLLSAGGIYALMAFTITRRRREIGIRSALGAGPRRVLGSVLRRAAGQIAVGIAIGVTIAGALQWGAGGGDLAASGAVLLVGVAALMSAVGVVAASGPARRALRIQPTEALKGE
jgi:putative ABC transport system permease protein